jgi:hypothetical protein
MEESGIELQILLAISIKRIAFFLDLLFLEAIFLNYQTLLVGKRQIRPQLNVRMLVVVLFL